MGSHILRLLKWLLFGVVGIIGVFAFVYIVSTSRPAYGGPPLCKVKTQNNIMIVLVCQPGLSEQEMRRSGRMACGRHGPCNAWMWDDDNKAPSIAPSVETPMTDAQAGSAIAVWINNTGTLNVCSRGC